MSLLGWWKKRRLAAKTKKAEAKRREMEKYIKSTPQPRVSRETLISDQARNEADVAPFIGYASYYDDRPTSYATLAASVVEAPAPDPTPSYSSGGGGDYGGGGASSSYDSGSSFSCDTSSSW